MICNKVAELSSCDQGALSLEYQSPWQLGAVATGLSNCSIAGFLSSARHNPFDSADLVRLKGLVHENLRI